VVVNAHRVSKTYLTRKGAVKALRDVSFGIAPNEFASVVGPSGCGKTTLLKIIAGLLKPSAGEITFPGVDAAGDAPLSAMVFQNQGLFPWMSVIDNITIGLKTHRREEKVERAYVFLQQFGLAGFEESLPHELSGGMRQRVALARAFISDAQIFLMDEPFGSLDAQIKLILQEELLDIWREHQKTVIYVTHDVEEAVRLSDRVLVMTGRPGTIQSVVPVNLSRPRPIEDNREMSDIKWHIWKMLEQEVRQSLPHSSKTLI